MERRRLGVGERTNSNAERSQTSTTHGGGRASDEDARTVPAAAPRPFTSLARRMARGGRPRRTVRMRLALAYGALFLLCGAALLSLSYFFVTRFPFAATVQIISPSHHTSRGTSQTVHLTSPSSVPSSPGPKGPPSGLGVGNNSVREALNAQHSADLHTLLVWFAVALGVMAVVSVLLGWLMAGRVLRPLRQITATTRHISEENLHQRLAMVGPSDEITDLAGTIDGLLARLEGAFDAQRAFVANASHELRTPLAMMRTSLDVAKAKSPPISNDASVLSTKVREGLDQADRLVESFLVLARAERGVIDDMTTVSLPQVTTDALDTRSDHAGAANVTLHRSLDEAEVEGSRTLLSRLAVNLIDNAIRYNQPSGWVQVTTTAEGPCAQLIVENSGPVLDPAEVRQLGRPFRRAGAERTGSDGGVGLGLSIVAAIAAAHHGTVEIKARPEGGLRVAVSLPHPAACDPGRGLP
ncbi:MAG TPA: HAMP domain-containing sensor histidine kinase [Acidimicrobiales bacterium]